MDESRLNNNIRQKINYSLRTGEPLPKMHSDRGDYRQRISQPPIIIRHGSSRRRTKSEIIQSGAYEREQFVPDRSKEDREVLKARLQNLMANGRDASTKPAVAKKLVTTRKTAKNEEQPNKFEQLMKEIQDRQEWLKEMEELGEGHKHREVINLQIQARLREMEKIKPSGDKPTSRRKK